MSKVLAAIRNFLAERDVAFRELHHEQTYTSEQSAAVRGEELRHGGKALLMKADGEFQLYVLPADRRLDSNAIRRQQGLRKLRFATPDELEEMTGLVPGSVPPFGEPILPFDLFVDAQIREHARIAFNAGSLTDSIILAVSDYLLCAAPAGIFRIFPRSLRLSTNTALDAPFCGKFILSLQGIRYIFQKSFAASRCGIDVHDAVQTDVHTAVSELQLEPPRVRSIRNLHGAVKPNKRSHTTLFSGSDDRVVDDARSCSGAGMSRFASRTDVWPCRSTRHIGPTGDQTRSRLFGPRAASAGILGGQQRAIQSRDDGACGQRACL